MTKQTGKPQPMSDDHVQNDQVAALKNEIAELQKKVFEAEENHKRAVADYNNLQRRTQEERIKVMKLAAKEVIERLIQPLEHLYLAQLHLKDQGLSMVYQQFIHILAEEGVEIIDPVGKKFDPAMMEAIHYQKSEPAFVNKVVSGEHIFTLNGEVIKHAKVTIGVDQ